MWCAAVACEGLSAPHEAARLLQVFFYCLDALPILLTFLVFIVLPYGKYLPDQSLMLERHKAAPPAKDGATADGQAKSQDESTNVLATV